MEKPIDFGAGIFGQQVEGWIQKPCEKALPGGNFVGKRGIGRGEAGLADREKAKPKRKKKNAARQMKLL